jgi:hypothetical protein
LFWKIKAGKFAVMDFGGSIVGAGGIFFGLVRPYVPLLPIYTYSCRPLFIHPDNTLEFRGSNLFGPPIMLILTGGCGSYIMPLVVQSIVIFVVSKNASIFYAKDETVHSAVFPFLVFPNLSTSVKSPASFFRSVPLPLI